MDYILSCFDLGEYLNLPFSDRYVFVTLNALEGGARIGGVTDEVIGSMIEDFFPVVGKSLSEEGYMVCSK